MSVIKMMGKHRKLMWWADMLASYVGSCVVG